jgi:hypothetical protein
MAKFSMKLRGKEVGPAEVYAPVHDMSGKGLTINELEKSRVHGRNMSDLNEYNLTVGNVNRNAGEKMIRTDGIKTRGNGAATKGTVARGPMG